MILALLIGPGFWIVSLMALVLLNPFTWIVIIVLVFAVVLIRS